MAGRESELPRTAGLATSSTLVLLLGGECKPLVIPPPLPFPSPHPGRGQARLGGLGNPQSKDTRVVARWAPRKPLTSEARGGWARPPAPTPFPPRSSPLHTLSISRGTWCYTLVLSSSWGGREEGRAAPRGPPPRGSSEDGADTSWAAPSPPAHQNLSPHLGCGPVGTQAPKASSWIRSYHLLAPSSPTYSPWLGPLRMGTPRPRPPPSGIALLLLWNPSTRLSICPSILVPS